MCSGPVRHHSPHNPEARIVAEHKLDEAQAAEKQSFTAALKKGWTQAELNKLSAKPRRRSKKEAATHVEEPTQ